MEAKIITYFTVIILLLLLIHFRKNIFLILLEQRLVKVRQKIIERIGYIILENNHQGLKQKKISEKKSLPQYKFYTLLVQQLVLNFYKYGFKLTPLLSSIRQGVIEDDRFERMMYRDFIGAIFQYCFINIITWSFMAFSRHMGIGSNNLNNIWVIVSINLWGMLVFLGAYSLSKKKCLYPFNDYFKILYTLYALGDIGPPFSFWAKEVKLSEFLKVKKENKFYYIREQIKYISDLAQKSGHSVSGELNEVIKEMWFLRKEVYRSFILRIVVYKFIVMIIFYLLPYFIYLYSIFYHNLKL